MIGRRTTRAATGQGRSSAGVVGNSSQGTSSGRHTTAIRREKDGTIINISLSRKRPKSWVEVHRSPGPGVRFTVPVWIPEEEMTPAERENHALMKKALEEEQASENFCDADKVAEMTAIGEEPVSVDKNEPIQEESSVAVQETGASVDSSTVQDYLDIPVRSDKSQVDQVDSHLEPGTLGAKSSEPSSLDPMVSSSETAEEVEYMANGSAALGDHVMLSSHSDTLRGADYHEASNEHQELPLPIGQPDFEDIESPGIAIDSIALLDELYPSGAVSGSRDLAISSAGALFAATSEPADGNPLQNGENIPDP